jgi:DNA-binding transcriptional MerR regulator
MIKSAEFEKVFEEPAELSATLQHDAQEWVSLKDAGERSGLTREEIRYFRTLGLIRVERVVKGNSLPARISAADVALLTRARQLASAGLKPRKIVEILRVDGAPPDPHQSALNAIQELLSSSVDEAGRTVAWEGLAAAGILSDAEQAILNFRHGQRLPLAEIGRRLGISRERARQIEDAAEARIGRLVLTAIAPAQRN